MKTFVTGATGFIGSSIIRKLLAEGREVKALVRKNSDTANLDTLDVEIFRGDLQSLDDMKRGLQGCTTLYHAAADYRLWTRNPAEMYAINVDGTRNILEAAKHNSVEKVVYTSSVGTLGNIGDGTPGNEETPVTLTDMVGDYKKSKYLAEREAEKYAAEGLGVVIVNPSTPVGPRDIKPTPTGKIIVDFINGKMPAYLDTGLNIISVEDCAEGHILAEKMGKAGRKYILGNTNLTLCTIFGILEELTGIPAPKVKLPYTPILVAAYINEAISKVTKKEPLIPLAGVLMAKKFMFFDSSRAVRELGLPQSHPKDALKSAVNWFYERGYTKRGLYAS